jgi:hypothetical protein
MEQKEQLEFGFAFLDYTVQKAIVGCHVVRGGDEIAKFLAKGFLIRFSSPVLTQPLLEQSRRCGYLISGWKLIRDLPGFAMRRRNPLAVLFRMNLWAGFGRRGRHRLPAI